MTGHPETRFVETGTLRVGYEASGPMDGSPVVLLHGWPDDPRTWDRLLPALHAQGLRTFVPWLRGFGPTRFRDPTAPRLGQLSALGRDVLELADALQLERFAVVGHDWGARAAYIAACLAPNRVERCAALSVGWGTNSPQQVLPLRQVQNYWYHWYMALPRGEALVRDQRLAFTRHIWDIWNPGWSISDAEFATTAASFDNPEWAEVVVHSYRVRWGLAPSDPSCEPLEERLRGDPVIRVPTLVLHGGADPCNDPSTSEAKDSFFAASYRRVVVPNVGHFPQRQAPDAVAAELVPFLLERRR